MKIAVDLRSLSGRRISGVENYILNLLDQMLRQDSKNTYLLFYNAFRRPLLPDFHFVNSQAIKTRYPSKILNIALKLNILNLEKLIGEFDVLFMPNPNQFSVSPRTRLVVTAHDLSPLVTPENYDIKRRLWHKFLDYRKIFTRANSIISVSEHTRQDLVRLLGVKNDKIQTVYPGVDRQVFRPNIPEAELRAVRNRYSLPGDYILFLNTLEPRKNLQNLVRAFDALPGSTSLVLAGKRGWKSGQIGRQLASSRKKSLIKVLGYVEERDKPAVISMSRFLAYPSYYEGFGFQPLEAAACGKASVISSASSLPEILGKCSLMANPHDPESLRQAFDALLSDPGLARRLGEAASLRSQDFSWQLAAKRTLEIITAS